MNHGLLPNKLLVYKVLVYRSKTPLFSTATINTHIPLSSPDTQQMLVSIPHLATFISLHQHFALNSKAKSVLVAMLTPLHNKCRG